MYKVGLGKFRRQPKYLDPIILTENKDFGAEYLAKKNRKCQPNSTLSNSSHQVILDVFSFLQWAEDRENSAYPTPFPEPKDLQKNEYAFTGFRA